MLDELKSQAPDNTSCIPKDNSVNLKYMLSLKDTNTIGDSKFMSIRSRQKQAGTTTMVDLKSRQISNKSSVYSRRTKDYSLITPTGKNQFRSKETKADDIFSKGVAEKKTVNDKVAANNKLAGQLMLS